MKNQPILFVHGIWDTGKVFRRLSKHLEKQGWKTHALSLKPNNGDKELNILAEQVSDYVETNFSPDEKFHLIAFSMGGLVSRYYIQRLGGIHRVQKFLTISTPHNGTWTAYCVNNPGSKQMRPNSKFLSDLNSDADMLKQLHFTSLWTPFDLMIVPATSSITPHAVHHSMILSPLHPWMLIHPHCHSTISQFLENNITPAADKKENTTPAL